MLSALEFDEGTHTYRLNGETVPSVTQILKETGRLNTRFFPRGAAERGKAIHLETEYFDLFGVDTGNPHLASYKRFLNESRFQVENIEHRIYSGGDNPWAGTYDRSGYIDGRLYILDIKSGGKADWHILQLAAYWIADKREAAIAALYIKDGAYSFMPYDGASTMNADIIWRDLVGKYYRSRAP